MARILTFYLIPISLVLITGIVATLAAWQVMRLIKTERKRMMNIAVSLLSLTVALSLAEGLLRLSGKYSTYMEKRSGNYWSPYGYNHDNVLWNRDAFQEYKLTSQEFSYPRKANSLGFVDKEFTTTKDSNEVKILCLGDSFTEGDGGPMDSCYPRQMERILQTRYPSKKITVMNAGICGSDPIFGFKIYDSLMYKFHPNIVIQSIASQDFYEDIAFRGGFERFTTDGKLQFTKNFKYERLFQFSFLSRIYFVGIKGLNLFFINSDIINEKLPFFQEQACQIAKRWENKTKTDPIKLLFVIRPSDFDVKHRKYDPMFNSILARLKECTHKAVLIDLNSFYIDSVQMDREVSKYFWPKDGHHTSLGYHEMARGTANALDI
jgi:hypothetical protein